MYESGYYPPGAENDPRAPWNETENDPVERNIEFVCTLRCEGPVTTTNYVPGYIGREWDGEGYITVREDDDFSNTDWIEEWKGSRRTPLELINLLSDVAKSLAEGVVPEKRKTFWQNVVGECSGWTQEDEEADEV